MSEEYKTVCNYCFRGTWYETESSCKRTISVFCHCCGQSTGKYRPCPGTLKIIDSSDLDPRFTRFYQNRERVEVNYDWGEKERFYVGKSTGWKPVYLAIKKRDSTGGEAILSRAITEIRPLSAYR